MKSAISATAIEALHGRLIHFHGLFGTITLSLADAERAAIVLGAACERARDATPLRFVCRYPDCDGGPATGHCHVDCRMVLPKIGRAISKTEPKQLLEELGLK